MFRCVYYIDYKKYVINALNIVNKIDVGFLIYCYVITVN